MICEYLQTFPAVFQVVHTVRQESRDVPTDTREQQMANLLVQPWWILVYMHGWKNMEEW